MHWYKSTMIFTSDQMFLEHFKHEWSLLRSTDRARQTGMTQPHAYAFVDQGSGLTLHYELAAQLHA